ncbi:hypothetical protein [Solimonas sp. K1W22B-7]|uniref:hypothetical protein n=1 Tax=Solimonas sp. K1W22B-7 TaxID=2303331 RepID=UPI0013C40478|nr:hypothetical protein [Solimonas sp. K1W22B-7]
MPSKKIKVESQQFGSNREFLNLREGFPTWTSWKYSCESFFLPLFSLAEKVSIFGNIFFDKKEYKIFGSSLFELVDSKESLNLTADNENEEMAIMVKNFIDENFIWVDGGVELRSAKGIEKFHDALFYALGGLRRKMAIVFMFSFNESSFDEVLRLIYRHSTTSVNGATSRFGDWRRQEREAQKAVEGGGISLLVHSGHSRIFFPSDKKEGIFLLSEELRLNLSQRRKDMQDGSFWRIEKG